MKKITFALLFIVGLSAYSQSKIELKGDSILQVNIKNFSEISVMFYDASGKMKSIPFDSVVGFYHPDDAFLANVYKFYGKWEPKFKKDLKENSFYTLAPQPIPTTEEYCEIVLIAVWGVGVRSSITISYGDNVNGTILRNKTGLAYKFNNLPHALNYMNSLGWEFVNAYAVNQGYNYGSVYHYLMKRKIK
jgi:hypothetical protein